MDLTKMTRYGGNLSYSFNIHSKMMLSMNYKLNSIRSSILKEDGEHQSSTSEDESEKHHKERDRQMRAIVEREKEVQQQLASHLRNLNKEREHHKRDEAIRHFNALLADLVRNPDLTWKEVKKILRKDSRWESVEQLDRENRERIFNDHILQLGKKNIHYCS